VCVGLGFKLGFMLAKLVLYYLRYTSGPFWFGYFGDEGVSHSSLSVLAWNLGPLDLSILRS
jgi:hypothetical protein